MINYNNDSLQIVINCKLLFYNYLELNICLNKHY